MLRRARIRVVVLRHRRQQDHAAQLLALGEPRHSRDEVDAAAIARVHDQLEVRTPQRVEHALLRVYDVLRVRIVVDEADQERTAKGEAAGLWIWHEPELSDDRLDARAGVVAHERRGVDDPGHRLLGDPGQSRDVVDRDVAPSRDAKAGLRLLRRRFGLGSSFRFHVRRSLRKNGDPRNPALETGRQCLECGSTCRSHKGAFAVEHSGSMPIAACRIHNDDDVAVVLTDAPAGAIVELTDGTRVIARTAVPRGHKVALAGVVSGADVRKYGAIIGRARRAIAPGEHVHTDNLETRLAGPVKFDYVPVALPAIALSAPLPFRGYRRGDGRAGTRNELWIIATVGCVARLSQRLAAAGQQRFAGRVDGVHALTHPFGCSQTGRDLDNTRRILASLAAHPNAGGVLIVGLGCETNQARELLNSIQRPDLTRVRVLAAQAEGDEFDAGTGAARRAVRARRARHP